MSSIQQFLYDDSFFNDGSSLLTEENNSSSRTQTEGIFIVKTFNGIKKKHLRLGPESIRYSNKKFINFVNSQLQEILADSTIFGIKLRKNDNEIEIYGLPSYWLKSLRKFTIQFDFSQRYQIISQLHKGKNSKVFKIVNIQTKETAAAKIFEKETILKKKEILEFIQLEISALRVVNHKNIIHLNEIYEDQSYIILVLQFCNGGELSNLINKYGNPEYQVQTILKQLLLAVNYLHDNKIFHRDIKLSNILFAEQTNPQSLVLCDFGLSESYDQKELSLTKCGTVGYTAPEILQGKLYDEKIDIFSIGVVTYVLLTGQEPIQGKSYQEKKRLNCLGDINQINMNNSRNCLDLLQKLLQKDPRMRISCSEALLHPFILYGSGSHCEIFSLKSKHQKLHSLQISLFVKDSLQFEDPKKNLLTNNSTLSLRMSHLHSLSNTPRLPYL